MKMRSRASTVFIMLSVPTVAMGASFYWTGNSSSNWTTNSNWVGSTNYPGDGANGNGDAATIDDPSNNPAVVINATLSDLSTISLDADALPLDNMSLQLQSSTVLATSDLVLIKGDQGGSYTATLDVDSGASFEPDSMEFYGDNTSGGKAIGIFGEDVSVAFETSLLGYVDFNVASGKTFYAADIVVNDADAQLDLLGSGIVDAGSLTIDAEDAAADRSLTISQSSGSTYFTPGDVFVQTDLNNDNNPASLVVNCGVEFAPDSMRFVGHVSDPQRIAYGVIDADVPPSPMSARGTLDIEGQVDLEIRRGNTLRVSTFTVHSGADLNLVAGTDCSGSGTAVIRASKVVFTDTTVDIPANMELRTP